MNEISIVIPASAYRTFEPSVQQAIMSFLVSQFGASATGSTDAVLAEGRDEKGLSKLDVSEAKLFLNNCSDKTTTLLREIVARNGDFMASEIADVFNTSANELRSAWGGLTKRVRTVAKNPDAKLLNWFKKGHDWRGIMAAQTVAAMRVALDERA